MSYFLKNLYSTSLLLALFPWVSFGLIDGGVQPYFIIMMFITLLIHLLMGQALSKDYFLLIFVTSAFFLMSFWSLSLYDLIRETVSYSALILSFIFFKQYLFSYGFPRNLLLGSLWVWVGVGILQVIFDPFLFEFIVHSRGTEDRGVSGLASEPSFFGLYVSTIASLLIFFSPKKDVLKILIPSLIGVVISGSIVGVYFFIFFVGAALIDKKIISLKLTIYVAIFGIFAYLFFLSEMRLGMLVRMFFEDGITSTLLEDESARKRTAQSLTPFILSYENYFLPSIYSIIETIETFNTNSIYQEFLSKDNKIGSYLGRFVFHWGVFFILPFIVILIYSSIISLRFTLILLLITFATFPAISPAYPIIPFIFVYFHFCFISRRRFDFSDLTNIKNIEK